MEYSAGVIATKNGKYHLIKSRDNQEWGFPKGHLDGEETEEEAAHRELYEEAGLRVTLIPGFREAIRYVMGNNGKEKAVTFFLGKVYEEGKLTHVHEICDQGWFTYQEALEKLPHEDARALLSKAHQFSSSL